MIGAEGVRPPEGISGLLVPALAPRGEITRKDQKVDYLFSLRNNCLSGLIRLLPFFINLFHAVDCYRAHNKTLFAPTVHHAILSQ